MRGYIISLKAPIVSPILNVDSNKRPKSDGPLYRIHLSYGEACFGARGVIPFSFAISKAPAEGVYQIGDEYDLPGRVGALRVDQNTPVRTIPEIKRLFDGKTLIARMTPYSENPFTVTFNISGLEEAKPRG